MASPALELDADIMSRVYRRLQEKRLSGRG